MSFLCWGWISSLAATTREIIWLPHLLQDFGILLNQPTPFYCDHQSACYIYANLDFYERIKHIKIDCHVVCEKLQASILGPLPIPNTHQVVS